MLRSTFIFLKGVGAYTERRLWEHGIADWRMFLANSSLPGISSARKSLYDTQVSDALQRLEQRDARYFGRCLKPRDHWRLFDDFKARAVFLDIETTGTTPLHGEVTVVGLYANGRMISLVRGDSLTEGRLAEELARHDLIVTFFGSVFDLPYLQAKFPGLTLNHPHLDLCFAARRLGFSGGLKQIETQVGIDRPTDVQGLDGWDAVRLWQAWEDGDQPALDRLLRYNEADTRNLEPLAELLYLRLAERYGPS